MQAYPGGPQPVYIAGQGYGQPAYAAQPAYVAGQPAYVQPTYVNVPPPQPAYSAAGQPVAGYVLFIFLVSSL